MALPLSLRVFEFLLKIEIDDSRTELIGGDYPSRLKLSTKRFVARGSMQNPRYFSTRYGQREYFFYRTKFEPFGFMGGGLNTRVDCISLRSLYVPACGVWGSKLDG